MIKEVKECFELSFEAVKSKFPEVTEQNFMSGAVLTITNMPRYEGHEGVKLAVTYRHNGHVIEVNGMCTEKGNSFVLAPLQGYDY